MKRVAFSVLIGLAAEATTHVEAVHPAEPCAHSWILWGHENRQSGWRTPIHACPSQQDCEVEAKKNNEFSGPDPRATALGARFRVLP